MSKSIKKSPTSESWKILLPPKLSFQYVEGIVPESLIEFLVRRFRYHDIEAWEKRIRDGHVTLNGRRIAPHHILQTRDRILYQPPPSPEPPIDGKYEVLHEDEDLLVVDKSGNIPTSPSGKYWHNCLVHNLMHDRGLKELHAAHRLDRETSGINLFAKNKEAAGKLGKDFSAGKLEKEYLAVLQGTLCSREIMITAPLQNNVGGKVRIRQEVSPTGRPAETVFHTLAIFKNATLVSVHPRTGRTHQIRAHAAYMGHPVVGDKLYGKDEESFINWIETGQRSSDDRHLLHASRLKITHPSSNKTLEIRSSGRVLIDLLLKEKTVTS